MNNIKNSIKNVNKGKIIIIMDSFSRENEGDIIFSSLLIKYNYINFMIKKAKGLICLTLTKNYCYKINLSLLKSNNKKKKTTNFTYPIDSLKNITTGISVNDRLITIKNIINFNNNIIYPGHIFPLKSNNGGIFIRNGHTEIGCDITKISGLFPSSVICEIIKKNGFMARYYHLLNFCKFYSIKLNLIINFLNYRIKFTKIFIY